MRISMSFWGEVYSEISRCFHRTKQVIFLQSHCTLRGLTLTLSLGIPRLITTRSLKNDFWCPIQCNSRHTMKYIFSDWNIFCSRITITQIWHLWIYSLLWFCERIINPRPLKEPNGVNQENWKSLVLKIVQIMFEEFSGQCFDETLLWCFAVVLFLQNFTFIPLSFVTDKPV